VVAGFGAPQLGRTLETPTSGATEEVIMYSNFHSELAADHGKALRRDAEQARFIRAARAARAGTPGRSSRRSWLAAAAGAAAITIAGGAAWASTSGPAPGPSTPNQCIRQNGGDYNACNVGNNGRGDLPYRQPLTPNDCVRDNGGDYNACNVGNSGRGDLPYQAAR
jgi:hypothetical protein